MKKVTSMLLALLMVFSLCATAFAAELGEGGQAIQYSDADATTDTVPQFEALNLELAEESIVLLENNNNTLPLADGARISWFQAGNVNLSGAGSGGTNTSDEYNILPTEGIDERDDLVLVREIKDVAGQNFPPECGMPVVEAQTDFTDMTAEQAAEYAADSDAALVWISRQPGEGNDRYATKGDWYLSDSEEHGLKLLTDAFDKVIVCVNAPSIDMAWVKEYNVDAVLFYNYAGAQGGRALANILAGDVNPSGKLVDTLASLESYPSYPNFDTFALAVNEFTMTSDTPRHFPWWLDTPNPGYGYLNGDWVRPYDEYYFTKYEEGIYNGYRYFETFGDIIAEYNKTVPEDQQVPFEVYYKFGYGLSYTDFDVEIVDYTLPTAIPTVDNNQTITVKAKVTNTGDVAGKDVVEIYYGGPDGILENPSMELVAYQKTNLLQPGESDIITVTFDAYDMSDWYEEIASYILMGGDWTIYVGDSIDNAKEHTFTWNCAAEDYTVVAVGENAAGPDQEGGTYDQYLDEFPEIKLTEMSKKDYANTKPDGAEGLRKRSTAIRDGSDRNIFDGVVNGQMGSDYLAPDGSHDFQGYYASLLAKTLDAVDAAKKLDEAEYKLIDVYKGSCTMDQFLDQWSDIELVAFAMGAGRVGLQFTSQTENGDGPQGYDRLGVPAYSVADGPNKVNGTATTTAWACGTSRAQTWNEDLLYRVGLACGYESIAASTEINLAPGMNIHRNPLCGRNYEYYAEDPVITGTMAAAWIRGFQQSGNGVTLKHFALNQMEGENNDRWNKLDSIASERTIREIYLKGFEIVCKTADPYGIMTAYQMINGKYAAASDELVGILRNEWGFRGLSMTDWSGDWGNVIADLSSRATDICMPANNGMLTYLYTSLLISQNENRGLTYQEAGGKFDEGLQITTDILKACAASQLNTLMNMRAFYNYYADELAEIGYDSYEAMPTSYKAPDKQFDSEAGKVNLITVGNATVAEGDEVSIDVTISNNEGFSSLRMIVDSEIPMENITSDYEYEYNPANGKLVIYTADGEAITDDTVLFTISYKIGEGYANGDYPITVSLIDSTDANNEPFNAAVENGWLTVFNGWDKGDINRDGTVDNADLIMIARYLVELERFDDEQKEIADFNDDGEINNIDLVLIARAIAQ